MSEHSFRVTPSNIARVLSALESDLRRFIVLYLEGQAALEDLLGPEGFTKSMERFMQDQGTQEGATLSMLLCYVDFADAYHILNAHRPLLPRSFAQHIRELTPELDKLVPIRNRVAHTRPLYYDDCAQTLQVMQRLCQSQEAQWEEVRATARQLASEQQPPAVSRMQNLPPPDYEETGFIGRKKQVEALKRLCVQSPYPVITVFGDGGVGKSALALKVAYDLLHARECPFDAIIWTSSKTMQLTPHEIKRIGLAIRDSVQMFRHVSDTLAPTGSENPFEEVLSYLKLFTILLILDNLETVLDEHIRQFLGNLPVRSKVLITSRIGIGAYDYPFELLPLDAGESMQLFRALAAIRQIPALGSMPNAQVSAYCRQMQHNPLFLKWFVSCVQTGKRPEEILDQRHLFLEYCMSNVYDYLAPESQRVLGTLLCVPGQHSQAELAFLTQMDVVALEQAMRQLRTTTMLAISSSPQGSSFESQYELAELARDYLGKHHPLSVEEESQLQQRHRRLIALAERMHTPGDRYAFDHILCRSRSDLVVASYLEEALTAAKQRRFAEAEACLGQARNLSPHYFEVYRIEAALRIRQQNFSAARRAYEAAIELDAQVASLRFWYGGFLLRDQHEPEAALKAFQEAAKLDPASADIQAETARVLLYLRRFDEARAIIDQLFGREAPQRAVLRRKIYDLKVQLFRRKADVLLTNRDPQGALEALEQLRGAYEQCPVSLLDEQMKENLWKGRHLLRLCLPALYDEQGRMRAGALLSWFTHELEPHAQEVPPGARQEGTIHRLPQGKDYGFLRTADGRECYLKRSNLARPELWPTLHAGQKVSFWVANTPGGPRPAALNVTPDPLDG